MPKFGVWCEVSGGVTGFRQSWLKANNTVALYNTREAAADEAKKLENGRNGNPYRTANFSYQAREYHGGV